MRFYSSRIRSYNCIHDFVSDNSAFSEVQGEVNQGFKIFNQFTIFVYSQLQNLLPDSFLGDISNWDSYLKIDLTNPELPLKTPAEFALNPDFHSLIASSRLPRPSRFIEQSMAFCKSFCSTLMSHDILKSTLLRGLSCFDHAVILDGLEQNYTVAIEDLTSYFVSTGVISAGDKTKAVSQYRSFVTKLRATNDVPLSDWVLYLGSHYEMQRRAELSHVFRIACLCLPPVVTVPTRFEVSIPELKSDHDAFESVVRSLQLSYVTVPNVSSLYGDSKSVGRIFRLLGRGRELISDRKFSIWGFLHSSGARRTSILEKFEAAYKKSVLQTEGLPIFLEVATPSVSRSSSTTSSPGSGLSPIRAPIAAPRASEVDPDANKRKKGKAKKTSEKKD